MQGEYRQLTTLVLGLHITSWTESTQDARSPPHKSALRLLPDMPTHCAQGGVGQGGLGLMDPREGNSSTRALPHQYPPSARHTPDFVQAGGFLRPLFGGKLTRQRHFTSLPSNIGKCCLQSAGLVQGCSLSFILQAACTDAGAVLARAVSFVHAPSSTRVACSIQKDEIL